MRDSINEPFEIFASASNPGATTNSADFQNGGARGIEIYLNVSAFTSGSITDVKVQAKSPNGQNTYVDIYAFSTLAIGATGEFPFLIYPCASLSAGSWKAAPIAGVLPYYFRIQLLATNFVGTYHATGIFRG